jgi:hypothetical protein
MASGAGTGGVCVSTTTGIPYHFDATVHHRHPAYDRFVHCTYTGEPASYAKADQRFYTDSPRAGCRQHGEGSSIGRAGPSAARGRSSAPVAPREQVSLTWSWGRPGYVDAFSQRLGGPLR